MRFLALPFRNIGRRPGRSVFAATGVALAVATYVSMSVMFGDITQGWRGALSNSGVHALVIQDRQVDWLASSLPESLGPAVAALEPVQSADGELLSFLTTSGGIAILASGWATDAPMWDELDILSGARPRSGETARAALGETAAEALGVGVGDKVDLDGLDLTISAIFRASDPIMGGRLVVPLPVLQAHMFRQGTVTDLQIRLKQPGDPDALTTVTRFLTERHPGLAVRPTAQLAQDNRIIELLSVLSRAVVWIAGLAAIAGTANAMLMAVNERRSEIGLLIAVGWSPGRILSVFLLEATLIALIAGLAGISIGLVVIEVVKQNSALAGFLSSSASFGAMVRALSLSVAIGAASGILPALRALRTPADAALRSL